MNDNIGYKKGWVSEVFIEAESEVEESREYLIYDMSDLLGAVGGSLGLFLGWSLLDLTIYFTKFCNLIYEKIKSFRSDPEKLKNSKQMYKSKYNAWNK